MKELINTEGIWAGFHRLYGDAKYISGNVSGLSGDVTNFTGYCTSALIGNPNAIKIITTDLTLIKNIIKKYNLLRLLIIKTNNSLEIHYKQYDTLPCVFILNINSKNLLQEIDRKLSEHIQ